MTARNHLCCFPEGHRSVKPYMLPLKSGMIRYAYERELLVQPIVFFGIENAMSEFTFRLDWNQSPVVEYHISDLIDPKDYKPGADSEVPKDQRNLESFFKKIEKTLYTEFERNHEKVLPMNNRLQYLRDGEEKDLYNKAKLLEKSYALNEYARERRKKKRH